MHVGGCRGVRVDELGLGVDFRVVLVAKMGLRVLFRPTRVAILLATPGRSRLETSGTFAFFDLRILLPGVTRTGRVNEARVDDATFFGQQSLSGENGSKGCE